MSDDAIEKKEDERSCLNWQCQGATEIVDLSDGRFLCLGCGSVHHPDGTTYFGSSLDWDLQGVINQLDSSAYSIQQFFADLPLSISGLYKQLEVVSAVNGALLDEVQRLRQRIEKHEASHGIQQVSGNKEKEPVDEGEKADPSGEDSSSS